MLGPSRSRLAILVVAALVLWNGAFAVAGRVGIWIPIAIAALALDALSLGLEPALRRPAAPSRAALALGIGAALVQVAATYLLYAPLARALPALVPRVEALYRALGSGHTGLLLAPAVFVACSEELVFRGAIQPTLARSCPSSARVLASALVYALAHIASGEPVLVLLAFACGAFWGALRAISGSLAPGIVAHLAWDLAVMFLFPLAG
jgi:hypothetical protein